MSDLKQEVLAGVKAAAEEAVKEVSKSVKGDVLATVEESLKEFAKTEEIGTLRSKMVALEEYIEKNRKDIEAGKSAQPEAPFFEKMGQEIVELAKQAKETGKETEMSIKLFNKSTGLVGSGLDQGSPRPVDPTFAYMRQPSGIRQAFLNQVVGSANLVVPTLVGSSDTSGYANQGIGWGYNQPANVGDQAIVERTVNFKRYEGTNWIGEDVLSDNGTLLSTFSEDLYMAAAQTVAIGLANGDGTGSGSNGNINGLFNLTATPSGTSASIDSGTGAIQLKRIDFAGATLETALAGGQVQDPNTAAGTPKTLTGANATYQKFISAIYALRPVYRNDLCWVLSSQALQQVRSLVDAFGRPLFTETLLQNNAPAAGMPAYVGKFLGIDVYEEWYAPTFSAGDRVRFGVIGSKTRLFRIYDRMMATLTTTPITKLGYLTFYIRGRLNTLVYDVQAGVTLEFTGEV